MTPETVVQPLVNILLLGSLYLMLGVGINLIFGVMKVVNLAHGDFIMLGSYASYWIFVMYGINPILSILIVIPIAFTGGFFISKYLVNPLLNKSQSDMSTLMLTFGLGILLSNSAAFMWTTNYRGIPIRLPALTISVISLPLSRLIIAILSISATVALYFFLKKSKVGKAIRAISQNRLVAPLLGINITRLNALAFGIGISLACSAGVLTSIIYSISPFMGMPFTIIAFSIIILGGMGSFKGLIAGAFTLAIIETFVATIFGVEWKSFAFFATILLFVAFKPAGIAGVKIN